MYARVHTLLRSLLALVPSLPAQLAPLLVQHFPHKREGRAAHVVYVRNALEVCSYAGELAETVLLCVVDRAMQLDVSGCTTRAPPPPLPPPSPEAPRSYSGAQVEIQVELDELEEEDDGATTNGLDEDPFEAALEGQSDSDSDSDDGGDDGGLDDLSDDDSEGGGLVSETDAEKRLSAVRELVAKLDGIMAVVFKHLEEQNARYEDIAKGGNGLLGRARRGSLEGDNSPSASPARQSPQSKPAALLADQPTPSRAMALRGNQFQMLLGIFQRAVLPTFKSRHVQFLLFWHASLDSDFADLLLGMLLSKAIYGLNEAGDSLEGKEPTIMRIVAASYVASLVSRASYIGATDCRAVMLNLCAFLDAHLAAHASSTPPRPGSARATEALSAIHGPHAIFYAVTQAAFYIFCFRWRDLRLDADEEAEIDVVSSALGGARWAEGLSVLQRAITSPLNPLAHCSPTVVRQFAGVAEHTGLLYCWSIIESNSRRGGARSGANSAENPSTPMADESGGLKQLQLQRNPNTLPGQREPPPAHAVQELDVFFPFDPYRLRLSSRWVERLYRSWEDVAPESMRDEDETSDDDDDDDADESDADSTAGEDSAPNSPVGLRIPKRQSVNDASDDAFSKSLETMSIST
jgi:RNA polymerase I-specific transcription initiation factor RRN3